MPGVSFGMIKAINMDVMSIKKDTFYERLSEEPLSKYVSDLMKILCIIFKVPVGEDQNYFAAAREHLPQ